MKEEALARTVWRIRFGPVVGETTEWVGEFQDLPLSRLQSAVQKKFLRSFFIPGCVLHVRLFPYSAPTHRVITAWFLLVC